MRNQTNLIKNRPRLQSAAAHVAFKREQAKERQRAGGTEGGEKAGRGRPKSDRVREKSNEAYEEPPAPPKARRAVQEAAATQGISESTRQGSTR